MGDNNKEGEIKFSAEFVQKKKIIFFSIQRLVRKNLANNQKCIWKSQVVLKSVQFVKQQSEEFVFQPMNSWRCQAGLMRFLNQTKCKDSNTINMVAENKRK